MPRKTTKQLKCQVCHENISKYRCPACPTRYCSVKCFRAHKAGSCSGTTDKSLDNDASNQGLSTDAPRLGEPEGITALDEDDANGGTVDQADGAVPKTNTVPLKSLSELLWPPEPDPSIFTDPLRKEDPKPLRREELLRIATSPQLRYLLTSTPLPRILHILDSLPTPSARSSCLARLVGLDPVSLAKPDNPILNQRDSPPPLEDLLKAVTGETEQESKPWKDDGWWLSLPQGRGSKPSQESERVWIGQEERRVMRLFANVVCKEIEGEASTNGGLEWEV